MQEIKAKFIVESPEQFDPVLRKLASVGYTVMQGSSDMVRDRYFDTSDWAIFRAGWTCRYRQYSGRNTLTLKSVGSRDGVVFVREQIHQPLPEVTGGLRKLPSGPVQERLHALGNGSRQRVLFEIQSHRTVYNVGVPDDETTRVRLGLDRTQVIATRGRKTAPRTLEFGELECELDVGEVQAVERLALLLRDQVGLVPAKLSKFERGIQTAGFPMPDEQQVARPLRRNQPLLELIYRYLDGQLHALKVQQPRAWEGLDPEGVHRMRISIRRIRSALRTFRALFGVGTIEHLNSELRWLARVLGDVRDADVYCATFPCYREVLGEEAAEALLPYEQYLRNTSRQARTALIGALSSDRYGELLSALERFVSAGPPAKVFRQFSHIRISDGAALYIRPAMKRIQKLGRRIGIDSPARKLHKLRIHGKRLRYLLEFFAQVHPKRWTRPLKAARRLQSVLGEHQDACTARVRLNSYAVSVTPEQDARKLLLTLGRLIQREEDRLIASRKQFAKVWPRIERGVSGS